MAASFAMCHRETRLSTTVLQRVLTKISLKNYFGELWMLLEHVIEKKEKLTADLIMYIVLHAGSLL